jgi:hypothetical protein
VITWHVLHDAVPYADLGADFYTRRDDPEREKARLIARLTTLGYEVTVRTAA